VSYALPFPELHLDDPIPARGLAGRPPPDLARPAPVQLAIHDLAGRRVRVLVAGPLGEGWHHVTWDGRDGNGRMLPAGAYVATIATPPERRSTLILLVK